MDLFTTAYGIFNANAKCKVLSDSHSTDIGFHQTPVLPQHLVLMRDTHFVAVVAKIFDDLLLACTPSVIIPIINPISCEVEFGTIPHGPGHLRYF